MSFPGAVPKAVSLKVVLATDSAEPSGMGEHMLALASALAPDVEAVFALPNAGGAEALARRASLAGHRVKRFDATSRGLAGWLHDLSPDLVHVHAGIGWEGHGLVRDAVEAGLPVIRTEHLPYLLTDPIQIAEHRAMLGLVGRLVAVSEAAAQSFKKAGVPSEILATVRNGIAPATAEKGRAEKRAALGLADEPAFLTVARMTPQKGHDTLLQAFRRLHADAPKVVLLLVGEGPERDALSRLAADLSLEDSVRFLGQRDDVPDLMAAADFLVLPSLFEGLPLVLLEAMAARLPIVATRAVGSLEATGSDHPFLAEVGDAASLHRAMTSALTDAGAVRRATETLHRRFRQEFHSSRMCAQTRALYDGLVARRGMRSPKGRSMNKTRIGFIGAGGIANRHLGVLEGFEDVELAAFCDADFTRASEAAGRFGARAFADHRAMLEAERLDAVYVCVPPFAHGAIERDVIEAGLPFFVEKPVSLDLATARGIEAAVANAGLVTAVGYHWRYLDTLDEAREVFAKNPVRLLSGYWLDATPPPPWWWKQNGSGGQMVEQATHILDLCRVLAGEIDTVFGLASHAEREDFPGLDVATASTASLSFANGAVGNIAATCLLRWNHRVGLHLFADGVAMEITDRDIMIDVGRGRPVRRAEGDPVAREDRDFIDAVQGKPNRIRCPYGEAVRTHEVALAIGRSAASGKPVALSRAQETVHEKAYA